AAARGRGRLRPAVARDRLGRAVRAGAPAVDGGGPEDQGARAVEGSARRGESRGRPRDRPRRPPPHRGGAVDAVTAVQSRIAEIQQRFILGTKTTSKTNWASAAAAAGLSGTDTDYATGTAGTASEQGVVSEASKYLGVPYQWGGTDPSKGLDCSGLTQLVYKNLGIDLPRTASQQATSGQAVASLADARPG